LSADACSSLLRTPFSARLLRNKRPILAADQPREAYQSRSLKPRSRTLSPSRKTVSVRAFPP
jgi:hypothetical protein